MNAFVLARLVKCAGDMKFSVRLPRGEVRPFAYPETFNAYVAGWPRDEFIVGFRGPFFCCIQSIKAPF